MTDDTKVVSDEVQTEAKAAKSEPQPEQFLFADVGLTIHVLMTEKPVKWQEFKLYDVKSKVLAPGDSVPLSDLPPYQLEAVKNGKIEGARIVTQEEATRLNEEAARIRSLASQSINLGDNNSNEYSGEIAV